MTDKRTPLDANGVVELAEILAWMKARKSAPAYLTHEEAAVFVHAYTTKLRAEVSSLESRLQTFAEFLVKRGHASICNEIGGECFCGYTKAKEVIGG